MLEQSNKDRLDTVNKDMTKVEIEEYQATTAEEKASKILGNTRKTNKDMDINYDGPSVEEAKRALQKVTVARKLLEQRKEVITNRSLYELRQAKDRGHVLEGLIVAIANIDEVINIIKTSENTKVAAERLCEENWSSETIKPLLQKVLQNVL